MDPDTTADMHDGVPLAVDEPATGTNVAAVAAVAEVDMRLADPAPAEPGLPAPFEPSASATKPPSVSTSAPAPVDERMALEPARDDLPPPPPAHLAESVEVEVFKVPALPRTTTLNGLPADIELILSLGANEVDADDALAPTSNYEQVVKSLREKAGFSIPVDGPAADNELELASIEREMAAGGVPRIKEEEPEHDVKMSLAGPDSVPAAAPNDSSSSDSSDSSSSESDSDFEPSRLIPTSSAASTASTTAEAPRAPRTRVRKRPQKKAANDSDLSDDDVNSGPVGSAPTTEHEVAVPEIALPTLQRLSDDVEIAVVGKIESLIETVVVVRASTAGDWRVLDEGTIVCWDDRTVVGAIFETFGSVQQPFYSLRFPATAAPDPAIFTVGRTVHYAPKMASFVFTRDIRGIKGSDASNIWDEEVGAAEMEWSDDEAEQEYKRSVKAERRSRTASATPGPSSRQSSRQSSRAPSSTPTHLPARPVASASLPYDDDSYTPLQRPRDLHLMGDAPPPAAEGRRMFERDTGRNARAGGSEVEFEFSDDEGPGEGAAREAPSGRGGRGGARGRGDGRGRGRGGNDGAGRGTRGRGRGDDRGAGRGGRQAPDAPRAVAPLPRGLTRPAGLPARPDFVSEMPDVAHEDRRQSAAPENATATAGAMRSPPQSSVGPSSTSTAPPPSATFSPMAFGANTPSPLYPSGPSAQSFNPAFGAQQPYTPFNPSMGGNFNFQQPYNAPQPYGGYPQANYPTPPPFGAGPSANPVAGGHFNPRFFGGNQPNQGSAAYPPHGQQPYSQGPYPGYGGQPFGGQGHGGMGQAGQFPPHQQQQQQWPSYQSPGTGAPGPGPGPGGPTGPSGWQGQQGNGGR